jgi:hypothetical protein
MVSGEDIAGQERANDLANVRAGLGVGPGDAHQNSLVVWGGCLLLDGHGD